MNAAQVAALTSLQRDVYDDLRELSYSVQAVTQQLVIEDNATNPTYQVDVDAERIEIEDEDFTSLDLTLDITASGANGLDTGSEAASTWYFIWVIVGPEGPAGLLSTSSTAPTLPTGFVGKRLLGAVRNDASSNFIIFRQIGANYYYKTLYQVILSNGSATAFTAVDCSTYVPDPIAEEILLDARAKDVLNGPEAQAYLSYDGSATFQAILGYNSSAEDIQVLMPLNSGDVYYKVNHANTRCDLCITGFRVKY